MHVKQCLVNLIFVSFGVIAEADHPSLFAFSLTRSPETTQVIKFQKIAQEQTRCLRQARVELDQEKADSEYLRKEVARLKKDQESYKRALDETRDKLAAKADPVSPHEIEQLRKANVDLQVRESLILLTYKN